MRIIAGEYRGRRLLGPASEVTRAITDRAKQSLFDILAPRIDGARVYDCFSGTGSMGLESLSRGAEHATFFERDRNALKRLRTNIGTLEVSDRSKVIDADIFKWFNAVRKTVEQVDIVFLDPPYRFLKERPEDLKKLAESISLNRQGMIIFRHDAKDELALGLPTLDRREYGGMAIEFLGVLPSGKP